MTQFKMPSGTYDPLWLISRYLNTAGNKSQPVVTISRLTQDSPLTQSWIKHGTGSDLKHIILLLTEINWNIVLCGHISWMAHVNIINWRSLECQICNWWLSTLQFWLCEKWAALLSLMFETPLHSNEFASFRKQAWSNTQWLPGYGMHRLSPDY